MRRRSNNGVRRNNFSKRNKTNKTNKTNSPYLYPGTFILEVEEFKPQSQNDDDKNNATTTTINNDDGQLTLTAVESRSITDKNVINVPVNDNGITGIHTTGTSSSSPNSPSSPLTTGTTRTTGTTGTGVVGWKISPLRRTSSIDSINTLDFLKTGASTTSNSHSGTSFTPQNARASLIPRVKGTWPTENYVVSTNNNYNNFHSEGLLSSMSQGTSATESTPSIDGKLAFYNIEKNLLPPPSCTSTTDTFHPYELLAFPTRKLPEVPIKKEFIKGDDGKKEKE
jgi:hypothetical protein